MAQYLITVKDEIVPLLEQLAQAHGLTVEKWISVWLETTTERVVAMSDGEAIAKLEDEKTRASIQYLLRRVKDGKET
ncbi:MAG: hypothetical protein DDT22_01058 [candidate division WS2 bacterium]|nr:hypothetical protein [Candidatus Lithacetigena glycinireducens]MBT9175383.1 hypothetical protein [Candidatus Lithacetigena glycinireducens]